MKICIFSDVHGNYKALSEMLMQDGDADCFIFAGDIFGYFYDQEMIISKMSGMKNIYAVKGNHEVNYLGQDRYNNSLIDKYGSSYCLQLSPENNRYIEALPMYRDVCIDGLCFRIMHGGPMDLLNQRIYPNTDVVFNDSNAKCDYLITGHTHYQNIRKTKNITLINPGSLGQPRDGKGFSYCIFNTALRAVEFKNVNVDVAALLKSVKETDGGKSVYTYLEKKYGGWQ